MTKSLHECKLSFFLFIVISGFVCDLIAQSDENLYFKNPVLSGFHPDPSICRVNDDYYMVTSSFTWYPGIPVYHSKDLVNWKLISHAIDRPGMINFKGLNDNDGIWAVTIRYHEGVYYLISTAHKCGGNFFVTAKDPRGPWSDPVWLKDAAGIDPSLFWEDDGKCYYTGNDWGFDKSWPGQCAVWMQEIDLSKGTFIGQRKILTYGHASNATYAEGPHIYKVDGKYLLLMAEGGSSYHHAVTAHRSNSLWGPYEADKTNPVLSHRHLGQDYPVQNIGHADLVQTQKGNWHAVALGVRKIEGYIPVARETFLCDVNFENGTPIFNPGKGVVLLDQKRPDLPWTPFPSKPERDEFENAFLSDRWYFVRIPDQKFHTLNDGKLKVRLQPEVIDSLGNASMIIQKTQHHHFIATALMRFISVKENEEAGMVFYRTANGYYSMMKNKNEIILTKKHLGVKEVVASCPYSKNQIYLRIEARGLDVTFSFGDSPESFQNIGANLKLDVISDNKFNKFNGPGIGLYATSNGEKTNSSADFEWFEYHSVE